MTSRLIAAAGLLTALSACVNLPSHGGRERLARPVQIQAPGGFEIGEPDIILRAQGAYLHARVCRRGENHSPSPHHLEVAALDADGRSLWAERYPAPRLGAGRGARCKTFDLPLNAAAVRSASSFGLSLAR